jgi:hypothetical protein
MIFFAQSEATSRNSSIYFLLSSTTLFASQPYDAKYLGEQKIKHMSFHGYIRKLAAGQNQNATSQTARLPSNWSKTLASLEIPRYHVLAPCTAAHPPYPEGFCSKCQPSAISLQSQVFCHTLLIVLFSYP